MGQLEAALLQLTGVREGARLVAEQLRLDEGLREGATVHLHEGLVRPRRVVVEGVGHQFLAGAGLAADEHRGAAGRRLGHGFVDPLHGVAVADEVMQLVALPEFQPKLLVLLHQPLPVGRDEPGHLHGQAHHGGRDLEQLGVPVEVAVAVVGHRETEGSRRLPVQKHRDAEEGHVRLLPLLLLQDAGAVQEQRLLAGLGHHDGLAAGQHPPVDSLAHAVARPRHPLARQAAGRLDAEGRPLLIRQQDRAVQRPEGLRQDLQHPRQGGPDIGSRQSLAQLEQGREVKGILRGGHGGSGDRFYKIVSEMNHYDNFV